MVEEVYDLDAIGMFICDALFSVLRSNLFNSDSIRYYAGLFGFCGGHGLQTTQSLNLLFRYQRGNFHLPIQRLLPESLL